MTTEDLAALSQLCFDPRHFAEWVRLVKTRCKLESLMIELPSGSYDADEIVRIINGKANSR